MRFSITSVIAVMTGLTASTSAFVLDTYNGDYCDGGYLQTVNVWDNTCATWPEGFRSFRITTWGGTHQYGWFFAPDNCGDLVTNIRGGYVDSGTHSYTLGSCYNFNGAVANAIASYSG